MRTLLSLFLFFILIHAADEEYILGEGFKLPSLPLYVGGYFSTDYQHIDSSGESRFRVDDIAFLAYGSYNRLSYLGEFEFKEFYVRKWGDKKSYDYNPHLLAERLYANYSINDNYDIKVGKYNSPIGFWNLTPINVLRETTSNPVSTSIIFPKYTTGVNVEYNSYLDYELKMDLLIQNNKDLDYKYNNFQIDRHYGIGLDYSKDDLSLKFNGGYFRSRVPILNDREIFYALASLKLEKEKYQIMAEAGRQFSSKESIVPYAGYIQGVYRVDEKNLLLSRVESYKKFENTAQQRSEIKDNIAIFGYTFRPLYPIAFKAEYQFHSLHDENQALFSFSVLF